MSTVIVPRADLTSKEVSDALRDGLGPKYNVLPGMQMNRRRFGHLHPDQPDAILVGTGSNRFRRAEAFQRWLLQSAGRRQHVRVVGRSEPPQSGP